MFTEVSAACQTQPPDTTMLNVAWIVPAWEAGWRVCPGCSLTWAFCSRKMYIFSYCT